MDYCKKESLQGIVFQPKTRRWINKPFHEGAVPQFPVGSRHNPEHIGPVLKTLQFQEVAICEQCVYLIVGHHFKRIIVG